MSGHWLSQCPDMRERSVVSFWRSKNIEKIGLYPFW